MRANASITALILLTALGAASCAAGRVEQKPDHGKMDHGMPGMQAETQDQNERASAPETGHAGHTMSAAGTDGPWSYMGRTNPKPFRENRWEMVPVPGYGHLYLNAGNLSRELICAALQDNPRVMVDRATRKACGMPELPPTAEVGRIALPETPAAKEAVEHEHHAGMEMRHEEQGGMSEHWMAPEEAAKRPNPVPSDRVSLERGGKLYQTHCAVCHGPKGQGDGPAGAALKPKPANLAEMAGRHPDGDIAWKIENGRGAMPAWKGKLTESQIWDIVNFLKVLGTEKRSSKPEPRHGPAHDHAR